MAEPQQTLAGQPLQLPNTYPTDWVDGQSFADSDDPDRTDPTKHPWTGPEFLEWKNPAEQRSQTIAEEMDVGGAGIEGYHEGLSFARVVHNVLTPEECADLLDKVNGKGFTPALLNVGGGYQRLVPSVRDGLRVIVDSEPLSKYLLEILRPHLPETVGKTSLTQLVDLNERCRFLCYTPGQSFEPHCDGRYTRPKGHPNAGDCSMVTVQFYLHDMPAASGGATTFLGYRSKKGKLSFQPRAGSALIFTQDLLHEGSEVKSGIKYTMRTEAMYRDVA
mmetsp:Transcript_40310/g.95748  ORF Transcript_40310/g.95748 Transcript_40310/m.95748 type:complete len:276 (-) Transcript_40310:118-945(-)|eukprot:CAMPEP_0177711952 /NCGR_PEP_ID=MMETSP0484_2-20121128/12139_1 /TAXON_ID=354590 /ORGANISM="Rhodomonas lens, Strain RHODO" /LENGTH=275 /DNA_ID=CAMNT_0019223727 /DNA_START=42 /DNA_END=869 /DNA_ORIENTATION=-